MVSEIVLLIWFPEYSNVPVIDYQDFYSKLKAVLQDIFDIKLDDETHKNKIQFFIDSNNSQRLLPEDCCTFFDVCWSNMVSQLDMLSKTQLKWNKSTEQRTI